MACPSSEVASAELLSWLICQEPHRACGSPALSGLPSVNNTQLCEHVKSLTVKKKIIIKKTLLTHLGEKADAASSAMQQPSLHVSLPVSSWECLLCSLSLCLEWLPHLWVSVCFVYGRSTSQRGEKAGQFLLRGLQDSSRKASVAEFVLSPADNQSNITLSPQPNAA